MTVSSPSHPGGAAGRAALCAAALAAAFGCATATPAPVDAIEPLAQQAPRAPELIELAARDAALANLAGDDARERQALERVAALEAEIRARGAAPSGLVPATLELRAAGRADARERREVALALLRRDDLEAGHRARLEGEVRDDPLVLADARLRDARVRSLGRTVNALTEPLGRSLLGGALLPFRLGQTLVGLAVTEHLEDELTLPERQALHHWKRFVEEHPDAPEAAELLARIESAQRRWYETQRERASRGARTALRSGDAALALALAERALRYAPEDPDADGLRERAIEELTRERGERRRSLGAPGELEAGGRDLAIALLAPHGNLGEAAEAAIAADPKSALAEVARYALASADHAAGREASARDRLEALAERGDADSAMARHARSWLADPQQDPFAAWQRARGERRGERTRQVVFGPLAEGARQRDLPRPVEWAIEAPALPQVVLGLPARLLRAPFDGDPARAPAVYARLYLERSPDGEHAAELRTWLIEHERSRGNFVGALHLAEADPEAQEALLAPMRERAADQALGVAEREVRLDTRMALLRHVAESFPETRAGTRAGLQMRELLENTTAQRIRLSKGFLDEHPQIAGPEGLGLRASLLDGSAGNGELHPEGVALLGGRDLELAFLDGDGDSDAPPLRRKERISSERLARVAALLEETQHRDLLLDPDLETPPDPDRDLFLERARLGAPDPRPRPTGRSTFAYQGARERFGLVRGRESILPVEIVLQGSFDDFGLGAFPRIRMPRETPDAYLYR